MMIQKIFNQTGLFVVKYYYLFALLLLVLLGISLFYNLGVLDVQNWDEARHGVNAYEMMRDHNYIVNYYGGMPDYWNLKPPVSFWFVILGYRIFGFSPFGLRFFSAVAIMLTVILVMAYVKYRHGKPASLIAAAALISSGPVILSHCGRTGDPDALFLLFFTASMLSILLIDKNIKFIYLAGLFFSLAFMTKSWHAALLIVICGLYLILTGKIKLLNLKKITVFLLCAFLPIALWAVLRYTNDGTVFFKDMITYDLLKRSSNAIEGHTGDKWYYLNFLIQTYVYWILILFGSLIGFLSIKNSEDLKKNRNEMIAILLWIVVPFLSFSVSKTKIFWYIYPIFPPMAICIGSFTSRLLKHKKMILSAVLLATLVFSFYMNEKNIVESVRTAAPSDIQTVFQKLHRNANYRNANAYIGDNTAWSQSIYLSALLYGDLKKKDTGLVGFKNDRAGNSLILLTKSSRNQGMIKKLRYQIVEQTRGYDLVKK